LLGLAVFDDVIELVSDSSKCGRVGCDWSACGEIVGECWSWSWRASRRALSPMFNALSDFLDDRVAHRRRATVELSPWPQRACVRD
jgi:hypothetical protein